MALTPGKCTACGARIEFDDTKTTTYCEYCGTPFIIDRPKQEPVKPAQPQVIYHNYYQAPPQAPKPQKPRYAPPRPKIKWFWVVVGMCFYFFPGFLYLAYKLHEQHKWDKKYT